MKYVTFCVLAVLFFSFEVDAQVHQKFQTPAAALQYIGSHPVAVGGIEGQGAYNGYVGVNFSSGYGVVGTFDVFGPQYSPSPYAALISSVQQLLTPKIWKASENTTMRPELADFLVHAYVIVAQEQSEQQGIRGQETAGTITAATAPWITSPDWQRGIWTGAVVLSSINVGKQERKVQAALVIAITDAHTGQILWVNSGQAAGQIKETELEYKDIAGYKNYKENYPNSFNLAKAALEAAWK